MGRKTYRKIITSDELTAQINKDNLKLMKRFLKEKNTRCADSTIIGYDSDLTMFFTWNLLENDDKFFVDIQKIEFADFFSYAVEELKWGSARFARMRSALSGVADMIEKYYDNIYPNYRNPILKSIDLMPKVPKREKTILSEKQVNDLFEYLGKINKPQEQLLLAVFISSGVRLSESLRITTSIIDEENTAFDGIFLETTKQIKTKGHTKQGLPLFKYLIKDIFLPYYHKWLPIREQIMKENNQEHDSLFIKRDGTPATVNTIKGWVEKWDKFLDVPFYCHSLRHYTVTWLSRLNLESDLIIEIMGWKSGGAMYAIYNDLTAKDRKWKGLSKLKEHLESEEE